MKKICQFCVDDFADALFHCGVHSEELASGNLDDGADLLQCHCAVELGLGGEAQVLLVASERAVFPARECSGGFSVAVPEVAFHALGDGDLAAFVVDGCVGQVGCEADSAAVGFAPDALAERLLRPCEDVVLSVDGRCASLPCLAEEGLPLEVLVELVAELDGDFRDYSSDSVLHPVYS